jgi:Protein of unknown function (DUF2804)
MPLLRGGRPLKRWTYVGAYGPDVMVCAASARIGGLPVAWWAIWDRGAGRLIQGHHSVHVDARRVAVPERFELALDDGAAVEVVSPHGREYAWTRKRTVLARGRVGGRAVELPAIVDESAGYHARHTAWRWSAGAGTAVSGEPVAWNLVAGLHDDPAVSERTVWIAGEPRHVPPQAFADDLSRVGGLHFEREAVRAARENLLLLRSDYEQPFGRFSGELPEAGPLREGWGVMERHEVSW